MITWDGKSRNGYNTYGSDRGTIVYGTEGTVFVNRNGYKLNDRKGALVEEKKKSAAEEGSVGLGGGGDMTTLHIVNFFDAIRENTKQNSPIDEGAISSYLCHIANISYRIDRPLDLNPANGHILDYEAMDKFWKRNYEPGWEPKV